MADGAIADVEGVHNEHKEVRDTQEESNTWS